MIDRAVIRRRFGRAAAGYAAASRLEAEVGARMLERLDCVRIAPARVLDAGCGPAREARALGERYRGAQVIGLDIALPMLGEAPRRGRLSRMFRRESFLPLCGDLERIPLAAASVGLAWSNMALHWVADPRAAFSELHRVLGVEGLFMFSTFGPDTLRELRAAAAGRVHAFADMHDLGDLLVAAGFAAPVMDAERITMLYRDGTQLLADLRASGQTSALGGRGLAGKGFLAALREGLDRQRRDGRLAVTFEVVYGHAWKAAPARASDGRSIVHFVRMQKR
jgi:malonyl-CoA O-methyltransferase